MVAQPLPSFRNNWNPNVGPHGERLTEWEPEEDRRRRRREAKGKKLSVGDDEGTYPCPNDCGWATAFPQKLITHIRKCNLSRQQWLDANPGEAERATRYVCEVCEGEFRSKDKLISHKEKFHV